MFYCRGDLIGPARRGIAPSFISSPLCFPENTTPSSRLTTVNAIVHSVAASPLPLPPTTVLINLMGTTTSAISLPATGGGQRRQPCAKGGESWKVVGERKSNQCSDAEEGKGGEGGDDGGKRPQGVWYKGRGERYRWRGRRLIWHSVASQTLNRLQSLRKVGAGEHRMEGGRVDTQRLPVQRPSAKINVSDYQLNALGQKSLHPSFCFLPAVAEIVPVILGARSWGCTLDKLPVGSVAVLQTNRLRAHTHLLSIQCSQSAQCSCRSA